MNPNDVCRTPQRPPRIQCGMLLSLCMIVKDEQAVLARCLDSVKDACDEIVIADTGSTDATASIAARYAARILDVPWTDDFSAARNASFAAARGTYLLWLDADDVIAPEDLSRLLALKQKLAREEADMVLCPYRSGGLTYFRERIVRRAAGFVWTGRVHECIVPRGTVVRSGFTVTHGENPKPRGRRNLHIYERWRAEETLSGRDLFYYGRELFYNQLYTEAIAVLREMLAGEGWYVNKIEACRVLADCHAARGEREAARQALLSSFMYGAPRGGVCNALGQSFLEEGRTAEAAAWLRAALACPSRADEGDFDFREERTLYPLLGLALCCERMGDKAQARAYYERAGQLAPTHPSVLQNAACFCSLG